MRRCARQGDTLRGSADTPGTLGTGCTGGRLGQEVGTQAGGVRGSFLSLLTGAEREESTKVVQTVYHELCCGTRRCDISLKSLNQNYKLKMIYMKIMFL